MEAIARDTHAVLSFPGKLADKVREWLVAERPDLAVIGGGRRIELYKEVGLPADVIKRFGLARCRARMASVIREWRPNPPSRPRALIRFRPVPTNALCTMDRYPITAASGAILSAKA